jgi:hypothetical protein
MISKEKKIPWLKSIENIVAKKKIAPQEQFLHLPQCFQMSSAMAEVKTRLY